MAVTKQQAIVDYRAAVGWDLAADAYVGRFCDLSSWVAGPCDVVGMTPGSTKTKLAYNGVPWVRDGSMLNPRVSQRGTQGYDSSAYAQYAGGANVYKDALNVGLSSHMPVHMEPGDELWTCVSMDQPGQRPTLKRMAVLTCVGAPFEDRANFRSRRLGHPKVTGDLLKRLPSLSLAAPPAELDVDEVAGWVEKPWYLLGPDWPAKYLHPLENMPYYGRDFCDRFGQAALWACTASIPIALRARVAMALVQRGLDAYEWAEQAMLDATLSRTWKGPAAGHTIGVKIQVLLAGLWLQQQRMIDVAGSGGPLWSEDGQTFRVAQTGGTINNGFGGYLSREVGTAEWGVEHDITAMNDDCRWLSTEPLRAGQKPTATANSVKYRLVTHCAMHAQTALALAIPGARAAWDHDVYFEYHGRYVDENRRRGILGGELALSPWTLDAYDAAKRI